MRCSDSRALQGSAENRRLCAQLGRGGGGGMALLLFCKCRCPGAIARAVLDPPRVGRAALESLAERTRRALHGGNSGLGGEAWGVSFQRSFAGSTTRGSEGGGDDHGAGGNVDFDFDKVAKRVDQLVSRYRTLLDKVNGAGASDAGSPPGLSQQDLASAHMEIGRLHATVERVDALQTLKEERRTTRDIVNDSEEDEDMRELAREELEALGGKIRDLEFEIVKDVVPKPMETAKGLLLEIRAGTGGEEAALFATDLLLMYQKYAQRHGWAFEILSSDEADQGGHREVIVEISGHGAYNHLQFESGVHRVQRVPKTETAGRVHTSASSVAVMPQATQVDVKVDDSDLRVETYRSGGAGGQHVNTTDSAVRVTHIPTQISVAIQDDRSQHKNRAKAMKILLARLQENEARKQREAQDAKRRDQIGSGDRSERIRTYNFQQGRVTDHRVGVTLHSLDQVLAGGADLEVFVEAMERRRVLEFLETE